MHQPLAIGNGTWFLTTRWADVQAAAGAAHPPCSAAWERLATTYWPPLYAYARQRGWAPEEARDSVQAFFARILTDQTLGRATSERGRFRSFLLTTFSHFLSDEWKHAHRQQRRPPGGWLPLDQTEAETLYGREAISGETPEMAFERRWALAVLAQTLLRLEGEYAERGRAALFGRLRSYLDREEGWESQAVVANETGCTVNAVASELKRLRQRFRELLRAEVAHTVADPGQVEDELRHLIKILRS